MSVIKKIVTTVKSRPPKKLSRVALLASAAFLAGGLFAILNFSTPVYAGNGVGEAACRDVYEKGSGGTTQDWTIGWAAEAGSAGWKPACGSGVDDNPTRLVIFEWESGRQSTIDGVFFHRGITDDGLWIFYILPNVSVQDRSESWFNQSLESGNIILMDSNMRIQRSGGGGSTILHDPLGIGNMMDFGSSGTLPDNVEDSFTYEPGDTEEETSCEDLGFFMGWLTCPATRAVGGAINFLHTKINDLLATPLVYFEPVDGEEPLRGAWEGIRNVAFILIVPMALLMVISTALGFELFSAYTVKKALPRMVIATIFIALSWEIVVLIINIINALGRGVGGLITAPIGGWDAVNFTSIFDFSGEAWLSTFGLVAAGGVAVAAMVGGFPVIFITLGIFFLFIVTIYFLLLLRELLIVSLAIFAPIAILAWIFPANTKIWSLWRLSFLKLLLLYPIIMLVLASGRIIAYVVTEGGSFEGGLGFQRSVLVLAAFVGPFFFIPMLFKFAGSTFANIAGIVNNKEKGLFDRGRNLRSGIMKKRTGDALKGRRWSNQTSIGRNLNKIGQGTGQVPRMGMRPSRWRAELSSGSSASDMAQMQEVLESADAAPVKNDDDLLSMAIYGMRNNLSYDELKKEMVSNPKFAERFHDPNGNVRHDEVDKAAASIDRFRNSGSVRAVGMAAIAAKSATGSGYKGATGIGEMIEDINAVSGGDSNIERNLLAATKSGLGGSKRYDGAGAGFGDLIATSNGMKAGTLNREQAGEKIIKASLEAQGAGAVLGGKPDATKAFVPALQSRITDSLSEVTQAQQTGDQARIEEAKRKFVQEVAATESLIDVAGQAAPQNAKILADGLHSLEIPMSTLDPATRTWLTAGDPNIQGLRVRDAMDQLNANPNTKNTYREMRRTYESQYSQQAQQFQQQQQGNPPGGAPPQGPQAGGPPTNLNP